MEQKIAAKPGYNKDKWNDEREIERWKRARQHNKTSQDDEVDAIVERLRPEMVSLAIAMMRQDTTDAASKSPFIDIGPFVDFTDRALDLIGLRGVYLKLFDTIKYASTINQIAAENNIANLHVHLSINRSDHPAAGIDILPSDRSWHSKKNVAGSVFWLQHWVGVVTADKFIRDGSLLLKRGQNQRLYDIPSYFKEIQRMQRLNIQLIPFEAQHGFLWHYVSMVRPDMNTYPTDLAAAFCGDLLSAEPEEYVSVDSQGVGQECRHGFGHAVFYVLAMRKTGGRSIYYVRKQFRAETGFSLSKESVCEAYRMCAEAPILASHDCINGFWHSSYMLDIGWFSDELQTAYSKTRERCGY